jgi:hypothetical protein
MEAGLKKKRYRAGSAPIIEMMFDSTNNFILTAAFSIDRVLLLLRAQLNPFHDKISRSFIILSVRSGTL